MTESRDGTAPSSADRRSERLTLILVIVAVATIAFQVWMRLNPGPAPVAAATQSSRLFFEDWTRYALVGHRKGSERPAVTVILFSNLLCEFCIRQHPELDRVLGAYPDHVAIIHRHLPNNTPSYNLALAMECAEQQSVGGAWRFADSAYVAGSKDTKYGWGEIAKRLSLDVAKIDRCIRAPATSELVERDLTAAQTLKLAGTPALLIDGYLYRGLTPADTILALVRNALKARRSAD